MIVLRDAKKGELEKIREQRVQSYHEHSLNIPKEHWEALKQAISSEVDTLEGAECIVAELEGEIVGSVVLFPAKTDAYEGYVSGIDYPEIRMLCVDRFARGKGVAKLLISECVNRAKNLGYQSIGLHTADFMVSAVGLYTNLGFKRIPDYDFQPMDDGIVVKAYRLDFKDTL